MKDFKLTVKDINEIKQSALKRVVSDSPNPKERDIFVATCYIKATLDFLERNDIIKYTNDDQSFPYEPVD